VEYFTIPQGFNHIIARSPPQKLGEFPQQEQGLAPDTVTACTSSQGCAIIAHSASRHSTEANNEYFQHFAPPPA